MTHNEYRKLLESDEEKAQRALFDEYIRYVYTIVCNRLSGIGKREDIEDCVSDAFAEIFKNYRTASDSDGNIKGFIGKVADRKAILYFNRLSSKSRYITDMDEDFFNSIKSEEDISADTENKEIRQILLDNIEKLGEPDSSLIIQKYFFGRKSSEIGKALSMSPSLVRMKCTRALKRLKKLLEESGIGGI